MAAAAWVAGVACGEQPTLIQDAAWDALVDAGDAVVVIPDDAIAGGDADGTAPDAAVDAGPSPSSGFTDVTEQAGVAYVQWHYDPETDDCGSDLSYCGVRWFTGGAAVGDYDGDGWPDLFVTRYDDRDILFRNMGDGTFEDVTLSAGLTAVVPSAGAAWADVDDDGHLDLMVTTVLHPRAYLYMNQGDGTFVEEGEARGLAFEEGEMHAMLGPAFGDYDLDGWLDVQTTEWSWNTSTTDTHARLSRNQGGDNPGFFEDARHVGASLDTGFRAIFAMTAAFTDLDGDLWPDLVVVGDFGTTRMFWNQRDGSFAEGTGTMGEGLPSDEHGMGLAVGDIDGDGRQDWFVTSIYDERFPCIDCEWARSGNRLYRNLGDRLFEDVSEEYGVRPGGWGWAAVALDYDNDGDLDLAMVNGVYPYIPAAEIFAEDPVRLWRNDGAPPMVEVAESLGLDAADRGIALLAFDYDQDGDLDLFVTHNSGAPRLYRNDGPVGNHLRVKAVGRGARAAGTNRAGLGVRVEVRIHAEDAPMVRELTGGFGYVSQSENVAHFGLADHEVAAEVRILWPVSGAVTTLEHVAANQTLVVYEPAQ